MAELVLGLAKSAVEGTLSSVKLAIQEETKLKERVQQDLVFITGELQMMQSFLNVANTERARNQVVRTWVRQVRDLAYDVEDCFELVAHLDKKSAWWWRLVPSWMAPSKPLDDAVAEINQLKARVEDVSQRNMRYNLIGDSGSKPAVALQPAAAAAFDFLSEVREAARRAHDSKYLRDLICDINQEDHGIHCGQVIAVLGTGGDLSAASHTIKESFDASRHKFTFRAWVKLMDPFSPDEFIRAILAQFFHAASSDSYEAQEGANAGVDVWTRMKAATEHELMMQFVQHVAEQTYLVVLEDLSTVVQWDAIKTFLPESTKGSKIVVSTRQFAIARLCTESRYKEAYQVTELQRPNDVYDGDRPVFALHRKCYRSNSDSESEKFSNQFRNKRLEAGKFFGHRDWKLIAGIRRDDSPRDSVSTAVRFVGNPSLPDELAELLGKGGVVSVWGIAGVGKSTLVKRAYYKHMVEFSLGIERYNCRDIPYGWVDVSHPFDLSELSWRLITSYYPEVYQSMEVLAANHWKEVDPIQLCRDSILADKDGVAVIDGLQSMEQWDLIKSGLMSESTKATIVVITTEVSLARYSAAGEYAVFNVKCLEPDNAVELFKQSYKPESHEDEAELIVTKCGGLPKVIVKVACELRKLRGTWTDLRANFTGILETNPGFDDLRDLFDWMRHYFDTCPDYLKPCIFYLSVFPADHNRRRRLLRRWIAEGYCRDTSGRTAEENGDKFFSMLIDQSVIQLPPAAGSTLLSKYGEKITWYQANGFFHDYIASRSMEDNLVFVLEGHCRLNLQRAGHHLKVKSSWDRDRNVFQGIDLSRLRSLTVFGEWESFFISDTMRLLRVLDLEDTIGVKDDDLKPIGTLLPRLKFLSLRGCREIRRLPRSLGCLRQLQTLDVTNTSIVELPPTIIKLQKLQYIRAGIATTAGQSDDDVLPLPAADGTLAAFHRRRRPTADSSGVRVPVGIGNLTALHTLGVVNASAAGGRFIRKELQNITQLHKLRVSGINQKNIHEFGCAISGHHHLESLSVRLDKDNDLSCLDVILPHQKLRSLKLYGSIGKLPAVWITQLENLRKLTLKITMLAKEDMDVLQDMPKLVILRLFVNQFEDGELRLVTRISRVVVLEVDCKSSLHVIMSKRPERDYDVEVLKLHWYSGSRLRVSWLHRLQSLKEVLLVGSQRALESGSTPSWLSTAEELQGQLDNHQGKPVLKLE